MVTHNEGNSDVLKHSQTELDMKQCSLSYACHLQSCALYTHAVCQAVSKPCTCICVFIMKHLGHQLLGCPTLFSGTCSGVQSWWKLLALSDAQV